MIARRLFFLLIEHIWKLQPSLMTFLMNRFCIESTTTTLFIVCSILMRDRWFAFFWINVWVWLWIIFKRVHFHIVFIYKTARKYDPLCGWRKKICAPTTNMIMCDLLNDSLAFWEMFCWISYGGEKFLFMVRALETYYEPWKNIFQDFFLESKFSK